MADLINLLEALDRAQKAMEEAFASRKEALDQPAEQRVQIDKRYWATVRAFNNAQDAYSNALKAAAGTEAA